MLEKLVLSLGEEGLPALFSLHSKAQRTSVRFVSSVAAAALGGLFEHHFLRHTREGGYTSLTTSRWIPDKKCRE